MEECVVAHRRAVEKFAQGGAGTVRVHTAGKPQGLAEDWGKRSAVQIREKLMRHQNTAVLRKAAGQGEPCAHDALGRDSMRTQGRCRPVCRKLCDCLGGDLLEFDAVDRDHLAT